jgi:lysophospholipase L1-like esterase
MKFKQLLDSKEYPFSGTPVIAFLGDSVTHGAFECTDGGSGCIFDFAAVYHNRLRLMISQKYEWVPVSVINAGVAGDTAAGGLERLERDVISRRPDLCVVCYGLNDVNGEIEAYTSALRGIFAKLREAGIEALFLTPNMLNTRVDESVLPELTVYAEVTAGMQNGGKMDAFVQAAREVAFESGVAVADAYALWKQMAQGGMDITALLSNGINHPCREMHGMFAELLYETIFGAMFTMPEPEAVPEEIPEEGEEITPLEFEAQEQEG